MELMDHERILENEGLPFAFIVNLMTELEDILRIYDGNLVYQVEELLNLKFENFR
jgi:hypothetical protein